MAVEPLTYSATELAEAIGVSEWHVRRLAAAGQIPSMRLGKRIVFSRAAIARWLEEEARRSLER